MAPVIGGLDLAELTWSKFGMKSMWSRDWYLRRQKIIIYQCCLIFSCTSQSLVTDVLTAYVDAKEKAAELSPQVHVYDSSYIGAASYNIFCGIFVAFVFGGVFFLDLVWPERKESHGARLAWKICGVLACIFHCANAFLITIITATNCVHFTGASSEYGESLLAQSDTDGGAPLCYRNQARAVASVVLMWPAFLFAVWSCILLWLSINRSEYGPGPLSDYGLKQRGLHSSLDGTNEDPEKFIEVHGKHPTSPVPASTTSTMPVQTTAEISAPQTVHAGTTATR